MFIEGLGKDQDIIQTYKTKWFKKSLSTSLTRAWRKALVFVKLNFGTRTEKSLATGQMKREAEAGCRMKK